VRDDFFALSDGAKEGEHPFLNLFGGEGFADVAFGTGGDGAKNQGATALGGDHDDWNVFSEILGLTLLEELDSVHDGHVDVGEDEVEALGNVRTEDGEGFFAVSGLQDVGEVDACLSQGTFDHLSHYC
jgi:hypothetical protein